MKKGMSLITPTTVNEPSASLFFAVGLELGQMDGCGPRHSAGEVAAREGLPRSPRHAPVRRSRAASIK